MFGRTTKASYRHFIGLVIKMTITLKTIRNCTKKAFCSI